MATISNLLNNEAILLWEASLAPHENKQRLLCLSPEVIDWIENTLDALPRKKSRAYFPAEELTTIFDSFVKGKNIARKHTRKLDKHPAIGKHVWEFKTEDARVFGFFYRKGIFIAVCGDLKDNLKTKEDYAPYIERVVAFRNSLKLDPPICETSDEINDLL